MSEHEWVDARPLYTNRLIFDMLNTLGRPQDIPDIIRSLGMTPPGPESYTREMRISGLRLKYAKANDLKVAYLSQIAAQIVIAFMLDDTDDDEETDSEFTAEQLEDIHTYYAAAIYLGATAIIASIVYDDLAQQGKVPP